MEITNISLTMEKNVIMALSLDVTKTAKLSMDGFAQRLFYNLPIVFQIMFTQHTVEMENTLHSLENNVMMEI